MNESPSGNDVPDVVGFAAIDACDIVRAAGLMPFGPDLKPLRAWGTIVAQEPEPASILEAGAPVVLWTENRRAAGDRVPEPAGSAGADPG